MTLYLHTKVLLHVWLYDFYDMILSTEEHQRHMIIKNIKGGWLHLQGPMLMGDYFCDLPFKFFFDKLHFDP